MKIAIEGCCHGELQKIYATVQYANERLRERGESTIELLICCGDFEAIRTAQDMHCVQVPLKYRRMKDFHRYYSGELEAPVPTLFIGGNHEASNHLWELYYGGHVAKNIYFLGLSGVVKFVSRRTGRFLRIAGMSGIYKHHDFDMGYFERLPYSEEHLRSIYHQRSFEEYKLKHMTQWATGSKPHIDIALSHDWPAGITRYGDEQGLLRAKPFFRQDIGSNRLGSPAAMRLLQELKPRYWFSGHLHVKFAAVLEHKQQQVDDGDNNDDHGKGKNNADDTVECQTKFLALDKCEKNRNFLQIVDIEMQEPSDERSEKMDDQMSDSEEGEGLTFCHDVDWLAVVKATHNFMPVQAHKARVQMPKDLVDKSTLLEMRQWVVNKMTRDPSALTVEIPPFDSSVVTGAEGNDGGGNVEGAAQGGSAVDIQPLPNGPPVRYADNMQTRRMVEFLEVPNLVMSQNEYSKQMQQSMIQRQQQQQQQQQHHHMVMTQAPPPPSPLPPHPGLIPPPYFPQQQTQGVMHGVQSFQQSRSAVKETKDDNPEEIDIDI